MTKGTSCETKGALRAANRARAWTWGAALGGPATSVWQLERFKIVTANADYGQFMLPGSDLGRFSLVSWLRAFLAMLLAGAIWFGYLVRHRAGAGQEHWPSGTARAMALHGEVSTRTRHLLEVLAEAEPPVQAIILLGRLRHPPAQIRTLWSEAMPAAPLYEVPVFLPMSPSAALQALGDLPGLIREGLGQAARATSPVRLRDEVAMAFRVFLGAVAARWWAQNGLASEVVFGITGTGDTTLLERAIHRTGGRSVHAVHGQATGPNFLGTSDLALFRSRYDARAYARLGAYGACSVQNTPTPQARRGATGLLLLSNLAHPMNYGFQRFGLRDEEALLAVVGEAARILGTPAQPLRWKPHPVIADLPVDTRNALRACALRHGFEEVSADSPVERVAQNSRWVVTSPSTVALDLLRAGYLGIVLDPQGSVLDTALAGLPGTVCDPQSLAALCRDLDPRDNRAKALALAFETIGPARTLDLRARLE